MASIGEKIMWKIAKPCSMPLNNRASSRCKPAARSPVWLGAWMVSRSHEVATGDFPFRPEGAGVVFGSVDVERNFWPVENAQQRVLVAKQPSEQPIEHRVAP